MRWRSSLFWLLVGAPPLFGIESLVEEEERVPTAQIRYELVKLLIQDKGAVAEAQHHLDLLRQERESDEELELFQANLFLHRRRYAQANVLVTKVLHMQPQKSDLLVQLAWLELELGHAASSRALFEKVLTEFKQGDREFLFMYAGAMQRWGENTRAQALLLELICEEPTSVRLWVGLAKAYTSAQRYEEAEQIYLDLLVNEKSSELLLALAGVAWERRDYAAVLEWLEQIEEGKLEQEVWVLQAQASAKLGDEERAVALYEQLALMQKESRVAVDFLVQAYQLLRKSDTDAADCLFLRLLELEPQGTPQLFYTGQSEDISTPQEALEWGQLYLDGGDIEGAITFYRLALGLDPHYFPAKLGLADLLSLQFSYRASQALYEELIAQFPNNSKLLLQRARVVSWDKRYAQALCLYNRLIAEEPHNPQLLLEKARVAMWWQEADLAFCTYKRLLKLEDLPERLRQFVFLEMQARYALWNFHYLQALAIYQRLIPLSPGDGGTLFDYAETWCSLRMCECAARVFEEIHQIDALNSSVNLALERHRVLERPAGIGQYDFWSEDGRGGLSGITRHAWRPGLEYPLNCQSGFRFYENILLDHTFIHARNFVAQALTLEYANVINPYFAVAASLTEKFGANYHLRHHTLGTALLQYRPNDCWNFSLGWERKDEWYNYFGVVQGIQSNAYFARGSFLPIRDLLLEGSYRYLQYTDHNHLNLAQLGAFYQLSEYPRILKLSLQAEYRNTAYVDEFVYVGDELVDIIHPYWSPQDYYAGRVGLEFYQDVARFSFCGAEKRYYILRAVVGDDTEDNLGYSLAVDWVNEWCNRWRLKVSAILYRSRQWNAGGVKSELSYRF